MSITKLLPLLVIKHCLKIYIAMQTVVNIRRYIAKFIHYVITIYDTICDRAMFFHTIKSRKLHETIQVPI